MGINYDNLEKLTSLDRWGLTSAVNLGHEVTLVCGAPGKLKRRKEYMVKGVKVIELPIRHQFTSTSKIIKGMYKELMKIDADIFHAHHYGSFVPEITAIVAKKRKIPIFMTIHNTFDEMTGIRWIIQKGYLLFMQPFINMFDGIFFISNFIKDRFYFDLLQRKRKILLRNYVRFTPPPLENIERKTNSIMYLGGVKPVKGVDILIKEFKKLNRPELELHIIGSYAEHKEYQKYLEKISKGLNIKFYGPLFGKDKFKHLYENTILVVPSRKECFCNVVIEGMACEIPVIVSNGEALPETAGGKGLVFKLKKPGDLTKKLRYLLDNPDIREQKVKEAKEYSKFYTKDKIGKNLLYRYTKALNKKQNKNHKKLEK